MQPDPERDDGDKQNLGLAYGIVFGAALGVLASVMFDVNMGYALILGAAAGIIFGLAAGRVRP